MVDFSEEKPCRALSLDGGGAKGFYTLGVLREIEGMVKCPLHEKFDLIFGTSTGKIIAALLVLGKSVKEISDLYEQHVPTVMQKKGRREKSLAPAKLGDEVFGEDKFDKMKTGNCTAKHKATNQRFKPTVRIYKNMRNYLVDSNMLRDGTAPSYFIVGMLWNVPADKFGASYEDTFVATFILRNLADVYFSYTYLVGRSGYFTGVELNVIANFHCVRGDVRYIALFVALSNS